MKTIAAVLAVVLVLTAAPAWAGVSAAQSDPFSQIREWLWQAQSYIWQIYSLAEQLRQQVFQIIASSLQSGGGGQLLSQVQAVLQALGQLGGPFGYAYQGVIADLQRLVGVGQPADVVGTAPWFVANNPSTQRTVARATESGLTTAQAVTRSREAATTSQQLASNLATSTDIKTTAAQSYAIANELASSGQGVSSSRAGIQVLIAGQAAAIRAQADAMQAVGERITALSQQQAASAQQVDALTEAAKQIADNQQAALQKEEEEKQEVLLATQEAATKTVDAAITFLMQGIVGQATTGDRSGLFKFRRR